MGLYRQASPQVKFSQFLHQQPTGDDRAMMGSREEPLVLVTDSVFVLFGRKTVFSKLGKRPTSLVEGPNYPQVARSIDFWL